MAFNPYITQHYGSSMELMSAGGDEEQVDAAVGFRRFPNAAHMTHTVFKPKNAPAASSSPAPASSTANNANSTNNNNNALSARVVDTSDVLAALRLHRGVLIDNFPSRPITPRGNSSMASLPPLLPADRSSAGSSESLRDRGAGLLRNWVKAATTATTTSSSSTSASSSPTPHSSAGSPSPPPSHAAAAGATSTTAVTTTATAQPAQTATTRSEEVTGTLATDAAVRQREAAASPVPSPKENVTTRRSRASPPPLPITANAAVTTGAVFSPPPPPPHPSLPSAPAPAAAAVPDLPAAMDHNFPSVSVSPESPHLGSTTKGVSVNQTPTPEPEHTEDAVSAMLLRSRAALEHVQRVLGEKHTEAAPSSGEEGGARPLVPPPPLSTPPHIVTAGKEKDAPLPAVSEAVGAAGSSSERSPEDSMDFVSPLSVNHNDQHRFPVAARVAEGGRISTFSAVVNGGEAVAVPDETRFMVLRRVADPAAVVLQRMRRRGGGGQVLLSAQQQQQEEHHVIAEPASARSRHRRDGQRSPSAPQPQTSAAARRLAEVPHADPTTTTTAAAAASSSRQSHVFGPISLSSAAAHVEPAATQPRRRSPSVPPSPNATAHTDHPAAPRTTSRHVETQTRLQYEDPSLLQELAEFLRAGNSSGFSTLSAALATPPAPTRSPRARERQRRPPPRASTTAGVVPPPPAPTVLVGNPPAAPPPSSSSLPPSAPFDRAFTPSSQLARVTPQTEGTPTLSPRRTSLRSRRVSSLPSYAQPTISWLSKGSEASADDFPVTHSPPPSIQSAKEDGSV